MSDEKRNLTLCSCNHTMQLDAKLLSGALGLGAPPTVHHALCRKRSEELEAALASGAEATVACTQEAALFGEIAAERKKEGTIRFVNIREAAGWSKQGRDANAKVAALLALSQLPDPEPVPVVSYKSEGQVLILGPANRALPWAEKLAAQLDVSVLLTGKDRGADLPVSRDYPVYSGELVRISGWLGAFEVSWRQTNPIDLEICTRCNACIYACPEDAIDFSYQIDLDKCKSHRACVAACGEVQAIDFRRTDTARQERFDLLLDLNDAPYFTMHQPPQGYFAPGDAPVRLAGAVLELIGAVGEFEKPRFFAYKEKICAHNRSKIKGCTACIDLCSTKAISPDGDRVRVEPHLCMGCGACATVCPSGAMSYAYPRVADQGARLKTLLTTYREAGGRNACVLFHNLTGGRELIARLARHGKGLPARVIPLEVHHVASIGMDLTFGAIALGASQVAVLATGEEASEYLDALSSQMQIGRRIMHGLGYAGVHFRLIVAREPVELEPEIWGMQPASVAPPASFNLSNEKRTTLEFAIAHLAKHAPEKPNEIPLPAGSPFGRINVNMGACTLCMSCVSACPEGALLDSPDFPRLNFIERNCVQCGLCEATCPEDAITLTPRLLLMPDPKGTQVLHEAEPFNCVRCGKPFATRQVIDNMLDKLSNHRMFPNHAALNRLRMCSDCRVIDMMEANDTVTISDLAKR